MKLLIVILTNIFVINLYASTCSDIFTVKELSGASQSIISSAKARNQRAGNLGDLNGFDLLKSLLTLMDHWGSSNDVVQSFKKKVRGDDLDFLNSIARNYTRAKTDAEIGPEVRRIIVEAKTLAESVGAVEVEPIHLLLAIVKTRPSSIQKFFAKVEFTEADGKRVLRQYTPPDPVVDRVVQEITASKMGNDLNAAARRGEFDHFEGRETEVEQIINILSRSIKSNVLLTGQAGVGKTAIAEGLALRIANGEVPENLRKLRVINFSIGGAVSGTMLRGSLEAKISNLLEAIQKAEGRVLLFIDEIHSIVGAGSTLDGGPNILSMFLQPLASGKLKVIGATTIENKRKHLSALPDFERRFEEVQIEPLSTESTVKLLNHSRPRLGFDGIEITDEATMWAAKWAEKYLRTKAMPDSALTLLDATVATARVAGEKIVTKESVARQMERQGIGNFSKLMLDGSNNIRGLGTYLDNRVINQPQATDPVARVIKRSQTGTNDLNRPLGSFLFVGPTGVGKTELARALAEYLNLNENDLIRFDMSEFMDKISVSRLIGSTPGYIGYEEGGALVEAVRRKPTSVILLDEIEKAHPEVLNVLLQVFEDGHLTDGRGLKADFRNTVIIMTSNAGQDGVRPTARRSVGYIPATRGQVGKPDLYQRLANFFRPEFLNRVDHVVEFSALDAQAMMSIAAIQLNRFYKQMKNEKEIEMTHTPEALALLAEKGFDPKFGARPLKRFIDNTVRDQMSDLILDGKVQPGSHVTVDVEEGRIILRVNQE